jgi:DNA-binding beta-propeller fold protein YncE
MRKAFVAIAVGVMVCGIPSSEAENPPLTLIKQVAMPGINKSFDHLTADLKGGRLFIAAEWHGSVEVYDLNTGKLIKSIGGMHRPHAVLYRDDVDRLYVTDGEDNDGSVRVFDAKTYQPVKKIDLLPDTDSIGFDQKTKQLFVTNGGEDAKLEYSLLSIIDTTSVRKVGEIKIDSDTIGGMRLESGSSRLYLDVPDKRTNRKTIAVIDRDKKTIVDSWVIPQSKREGALALDEGNHRLFVGVIEGLVAVLDTQTGKQVAEFQIGKGLDDLEFDPQTKRIYAACEDGAVHVYLQSDSDHYQKLGAVLTGPGARTGRLVSKIGKYYTAVPAHNQTPAQLLVYEVQ